MSENLDPSEKRPEWLLRLHEQAVDQYRAGHELVRTNNLHEDQMLVWLIGMAGGAIYVVLEVLTKFWPGASRSTFLILTLPWAASAFCGLMARTKIAELLLQDDQIFHVRAAVLAGLPLRKGLDNLRFGLEIINHFEPFQKWTDAAPREAQEKVEKCSARATMWSKACRVILAGGIVWTGAILMFLTWCH